MSITKNYNTERLKKNARSPACSHNFKTVPCLHVSVVIESHMGKEDMSFIAKERESELSMYGRVHAVEDGVKKDTHL